ncbi:hypothetical protein BDV93DRAFT_520184 [Ceratobasidium sp. AG-I]|nr:hypothetical protein BDV93DRAFT_520184 [Ceratobasidium sp. AG-I]
MSFVDSILQSAPEGSNPYAYAADYVATIIPRKPDWYFSNIIAAGVVAAINLISTIACFVVMWRRSKGGSGVGLWFFRTQYGHSSGVPYIMPNALTMFLFWNLIFMLLMQPYIWLNYFAYYAPSLQLTSRMYFWYGFVFIWDATGMWTSAFGTLYATLLPKLFTVTPEESTTFKRLLLHPITMNAFCFLPPFGLAITQIITSTFSAIAWSDLVHTQFGLVDLLTAASIQWNMTSGKNVQKDLVGQASDLGTLFLKQKDRSQTAFQKNAWTCGSWYLLCIILFTPTAVWLLWVIRDALSQRTRRVTPRAPQPAHVVASQPATFDETLPRASGFAAFPRAQSTILPTATPGTPLKPANQAVTGWPTNSRTGNNQHDESAKPLKRALYTASLQFVATFFCLGVAAGSWLWMAADAGRMIVSPPLHATAILLTIWVYVLAGCFVNLFILIRTRRIDDTPSGGNAMHLSAMKTSHASSSHSQTRSDPDRKPVYIIAHTTTHVVVDDPRHNSLGSDHRVELGPYSTGDEHDLQLDSSYSLSSAQLGESPKAMALEQVDLESDRWPRQ